MVGSVGVRRLSVQEVVSEVAVETAGSWGRHSPTQDHGHCSPSQLTLLEADNINRKIRHNYSSECGPTVLLGLSSQQVEIPFSYVRVGLIIRVVIVLVVLLTG